MRFSTTATRRCRCTVYTSLRFPPVMVASSSKAPPLLVSSTSTSLVIGWTAPIGNGADVFEFGLEMESGTFGWRRMYTGSNFQFEVVQLTRVTEYNFRVVASNVQGDSKPSEKAAFCTAAESPAAPAVPLATESTATTIAIRCNPSKDTGGADITGYTVELNAGVDSAQQRATPPQEFRKVYEGMLASSLLDKLTPGTTYLCQVACWNSVGSSPFSTPVAIRPSASCFTLCAALCVWPHVVPALCCGGVGASV